MWNLAGLAAPMAIALLATPVIIAGLGIERFAILMLGWTLIGYFSLFDLGLGRALTKIVAAKLGSGAIHEISGLVWGALLLMLGFGTLGALVFTLGSRTLIVNVLTIPRGLQRETLDSFYWIAAGIPAVCLTAGLRGCLEACQRFQAVSVLRLVTGILGIAGVLCTLPFSHRLPAIMAAVAIGRIAGMGIYMAVTIPMIVRLWGSFEARMDSIGQVVTAGGWMTLSNIVSPLMVTMDRFIVGALMPVAYIAYYTTPFELVTKLLIIPGALSGVLFPVISAALVQQAASCGILYRRSMQVIFAVLFPTAMVAVTCGKEILTFWLGSGFADRSFRTLGLLALGILVNGLAQIPFAVVQAAGRPDMTAALHVAELPFYLILCYVLTARLGIEGTALAWLVRVGVDALALTLLARKWAGTSVLPKLSLALPVILILSTAALMNVFDAPSLLLRTFCGMALVFHIVAMRPFAMRMIAKL